jgi:uncharacterized protein YdaU (DUF1376 family)
LIYYRRFPGDYLRDTIHLSAAEDGMYGRLLDKLYSSEKPLPLDRTVLYAMVRANSKEDQRAVNSVLKQFFLKTRYGFTNRRAKKELVRMAEISAVRSSAGKQKGKKAANAQQMLSKLVTPDSRLQTPEKPSPSAVNGEGPSGVALTLESQSQHPPIVPPQPGGRTNGTNGSTETIFEWAREYVGVKMGHRKRLFTNRDQESLAGARADRVVQFLQSRGFEARIVPDEEIKAHDQNRVS